MSTLKSINIIHPTGTTTNIVNDNIGNVTVGNNLTVTGVAVSPYLIGGTTASSSLTLKSTSGVGTSDSIQLKVGNNGATTAISVATTGIVSFPTTGAMVIPVGATGTQPGTPVTGMFRFNTSTVAFEGYNGTGWGSIGVGATGGGTDQIFWNNGQTVNTNYTIPTGFNSGTFGPITVASGVTVTVPAGSTWSIVNG